MNGRRKVYYLYLESIIKSRPAITLLYFQTAYIKKKHGGGIKWRVHWRCVRTCKYKM